MKTTRLDPSPCPTCGIKLDAATVPSAHDTPEPGAFTICLGCATILVFGDDLRPRLPTPEEKAWADSDPEMTRIWTTVMSFIIDHGPPKPPDSR